MENILKILDAAWMYGDDIVLIAIGLNKKRSFYENFKFKFKIIRMKINYIRFKNKYREYEY